MLRIEAADGNPGENALFGQRFDDFRRRTRQVKCELVEEGPVDQAQIGYPLEAPGEGHRGSVVQMRQPSEPRLAEQREVDREGERAQTRIGADVARRPLAPDVLL